MITLVLAALLATPPTPSTAPRPPAPPATAPPPATAIATTAPKTSAEGPVYTGVRPDGALGVVHAIYVDVSENDDALTPSQRETRAKLRAVKTQEAAIKAHASKAFLQRLKIHKAQCASNTELEPECEADIVLCAQDNWMPVGIDVVTTTPREMVVDVRQPGTGNVKVRATVVMEGKAWKLDAVQCTEVEAPAPVPVR